jgi:DNA-binding CsgD family transcriptional regulator/N-acetylneuraminic acid mutarotase
VSDELNPLSDREMDILRLLVTGATNRQIAQELVISINTVKVHLRNIYAKLGVSSRTEATMAAVHRGWVDVPRAADEVEEETPAALRRMERWPRVPVFKRVALVLATLLTLVALFLPQLLQSRANGPATDPIAGVFPTVPSRSSVPRWHTRAQMPTPRTNLATTVLHNLVYAISGISNEGVTGKVEIYDAEVDSWTTGNPKPVPVGFVSAVMVDDRIYVPGGIGPGGSLQDVLEVYDPAQDIWQSRAPMPVPLVAYGLAPFEGQIYLFGGWDGQEPVASVYRYDPADDRWESLQPMDQARGFLGAATLGDRIYVVGGYDGDAEFSTCDAYDPLADTWAPCPPMALPRGDLAVVASRNYLFAIGGGMTGYLAFNERYDPRTNLWSRIETPVVDEWRGLGAAFVSPNVYAIGGWNGANLSVNEAYEALYQIILP